jgi:hypothetical protein
MTKTDASVAVTFAAKFKFLQNLLRSVIKMDNHNKTPILVQLELHAQQLKNVAGPFKAVSGAYQDVFCAPHL